jgi:hypothetical protein
MDGHEAMLDGIVAPRERRFGYDRYIRSALPAHRLHYFTAEGTAWSIQRTVTTTRSK